MSGSDLRKDVLGGSVKRSGLVGKHRNFNPIKWNKYFDKEQAVSIPNGTFHIYSKGDTGPVLLCLHGGGYSGLSWALFAAEVTKMIDCQVVAVDLRGHGNTVTENESDLSLETLTNDVVTLVNHLYKENEPIVLIGHSMGGAVAVHCSYVLPTTVCLCVIDVVEGTAMDALSSMQSILRSRPSKFSTIQNAIEWSVKCGQTQNLRAARVSMPGQVINYMTGHLAAKECDSSEELSSSSGEDMDVTSASSSSSSSSSCGTSRVGSGTSLFSVAEDSEPPVAVHSAKASTSVCDKPPLPPSASFQAVKHEFAVPKVPKYVWRIDLSKTEPFWAGWFKGLSQKFLDIHIPKLLLLANIHGLDTPLTVGQMQGKFSLGILQGAGHTIHEDRPSGVAEFIAVMLVRNHQTTAKVELKPPLPQGY